MEGTERTKGTEKDTRRDVFGLPGQIDSRFVLAMNDAIVDKLEEKGEWRETPVNSDSVLHLSNRIRHHFIHAEASVYTEAEYKGKYSDVGCSMLEAKNHLADVANYAMMLWFLADRLEKARSQKGGA